MSGKGKKGLLQKPAFKLALLSIAVIVMMIVVILVSIYSVTGSDGGSSISGYNTEAYGGFPEQTEGYRELITELCDRYNTQPDKLELPLYVNTMLAIIEIESNGIGTDPMQSSECDYNTIYQKAPGSIKDPVYSCECGVQYARDAFILFGVTGPDDMERLAAAVQGYNFGIAGWYKWISERGGLYTVELAQEYSDTMMPKGAKGTPTHGQKFLNAYKKGITMADADGAEQIDDIVYYKQWDERWAGYPYGSSDIQHCGCGVTSMAMVIATFCDNTVTPPDMADMSMKNGGYVSGQGSSMPVVVAAAAKKYPINYKEIGIGDVDKYIRDKKALVIWGCNTGYFSSSSSGHVMVIRGVTDSGGILIADPNRQDNNTKEFTSEFIASEAKYFIAVWKKD